MEECSDPELIMKLSFHQKAISRRAFQQMERLDVKLLKCDKYNNNKMLQRATLQLQQQNTHNDL